MNLKKKQGKDGKRKPITFSQQKRPQESRKGQILKKELAKKTLTEKTSRDVQRKGYHWTPHPLKHAPKGHKKTQLM